MKTRLFVGALVGGLTACLLAWISGFDFNQRGEQAFGIALAVLVSSLFGMGMVGRE